MNRNTTILMAGALILALAFGASAQSGQEDPTANPLTEAPSTVMGIVESLTPTSLVIQIVGGDQMVFIRDATSNVPATVKTGDQVRVEYEIPEPGTFHLSSVTLATTGSSPAPMSQSLDGSTEAAPPSGDAAGEQATTASGTMPMTASPLATAGIIGALAIGVGLMRQLWRRR